MENKLTATDYKKINGRKRRKGDRLYLAHLKTLFQEVGGLYPSPVCLVSKDGKWTEDMCDAAYFRRLYRGGSSSALKKLYAKRLRNGKNKMELFIGCDYKRVSGDFWWDFC